MAQHWLQGGLTGTIASVPEATAQASSYCSFPSRSNALVGIGVSRSRSRSRRARQSCFRGQPSITFAQSLNSDNGSAYSYRPDPDHQRSPNSNMGDSPTKGTDPSPLEGGGSKVPHIEHGDNGRDRWSEPIGGLGSPVAKHLTQSFVDKSHNSLEGLQFPDEQDEDQSLMSFAGGYQEKDDASSKTTKTKENPQEEASDSLWRSVFPAYMQSKDEELSGDAGACLDELGKGHGVGGAAAARAAAAAAASAKELESRTSSFATPIPPSMAAPRGSSAQNPVEGARNLRDLITNDPIWAAMRAEARLEAEREPLLSSFLYASILAHPCFERSLGFVLANRLKNATLLATQLMDVFDDVFMNDACIRQAVRLDVQAVKDRDPSCRSYSCALLYLKGYHALQSYRVAHVLWNRGQSVLALALQSRISEVFAVDIHPAARIGKAILLDHGTGVVIGETAVVGDRVSMLQGVTLGGTGKVAGDRHPKIGEGVLIGAGATILGNITVGRGAMVAAGSLVLKDVPPHSMVAGTPAKVVGVLEEPSPSLTMKHDATKDLLESFGNDSFCGGMGI